MDGSTTHESATQHTASRDGSVRDDDDSPADARRGGARHTEGTPVSELQDGHEVGKHESDKNAGHPRCVSSIDIARIMHDIPHRYPFLLIDRVVDLIPDHSAIGVKNVSINEAFFQGHFPRHPVMPGVLIVESMAQTAAVLVVETEGSEAGKLVYLMSIDGVRFRRPVVPGDQLRVHVSKARRRANVWRFACVARVDGVDVAEATLSAMILAGTAP